MWWIFAVPTIVIALYFSSASSGVHGEGVNHAHYVMQMTWVSANLVWALGALLRCPVRGYLSAWDTHDTHAKWDTMRVGGIPC